MDLGRVEHEVDEEWQDEDEEVDEERRHHTRADKYMRSIACISLWASPLSQKVRS